ncbi:MAG: hypothetical protein QM820_03580 [Minicystis sp.]
MRRIVLAVVLVVAASGLANAAPKGKNVGDAEKWRESEDMLKRNDKSASAACDTNLTIAYDVPSFGDMSLDEAKPADVYCRDAYNALWGAVCKSPEGKEAVKKKVTAVSCRFSKNGTGVKLEGKTLVVDVDPKKKEIDGAVPGGAVWSRVIKSVL